MLFIQIKELSLSYWTETADGLVTWSFNGGLTFLERILTQGWLARVEVAVPGASSCHA
jgi:hypothetical protein